MVAVAANMVVVAIMVVNSVAASMVVVVDIRAASRAVTMDLTVDTVDTVERTCTEADTVKAMDKDSEAATVKAKVMDMVMVTKLTAIE